MTGPINRLFDLALLVATRWPPKFDSTTSECEHIPRGDWQVEQWRAYAELLEREGFRLSDREFRLQRWLFLARAKAARTKRKTEPELMAELRALSEKPQTKRGRKPDRTREDLAREALKIQADAQARGVRMTNMEALAECYARQGKRPSRARQDRTTINTMSKLRNHKN
ncbi:hypothetical protein [Niveibacterium sp. SC-1]|uniref:hypothetical protein n=1 Tax=Niveibacterium sp. SC-1 TaxID=3135646 RepID=UPI00311DDDBA